MSILDKIVEAKRRELKLKKQLVSIANLEKSPLFERTPLSLKANLHQRAGIIAEHKRRSPSKAVINQSLSLEEIVCGYENAGVSAISVLTDSQFFGGSLEDLLLARAAVKLPLLRKEFIIDEYQLIEAKACGADLVLLIAAILTRTEIQQLSQTAKQLGLEVLLEVHDQTEIQKSLMPSLDMIGVNNRNLKTFEVSLQNSLQLAGLIPDDFIKISESGLADPASVKTLTNHGYSGFLMGEHFMKTINPGLAAATFLKNAFQ